MQSLKSNINYTYIHILYIYPHSQAYYQSPLKNSKCAPVPYASFFPEINIVGQTRKASLRMYHSYYWFRSSKEDGATRSFKSR